jgi:hypothetical protein
MKLIRLLSFILIFFFSYLLFSGCSTSSPLVEDICSITTEICEYATLICDQVNTTKPATDVNESIRYQLSDLRDQLKAEVILVKSLSKRATMHDQATLMQRLQSIRSRIKELSDF